MKLKRRAWRFHRWNRPLADVDASTARVIALAFRDCSRASHGSNLYVSTNPNAEKQFADIPKAVPAKFQLMTNSSWGTCPPGWAFRGWGCRVPLKLQRTQLSVWSYQLAVRFQAFLTI